MGERFFDDLARTLAQPMPRRRALRVVGTSLVGAMVAGTSPLRVSAALGRRSEVCKGKPAKCDCSGAIAWCPTGCPYETYKCECQPFGKGVQAVCVPTSTCPESGRGCGPCCPKGQKCNTLLGECDCGRADDEPCRPAKRKSKACCKKGTTCCFNDTTSTCCGSQQVCKTGGGKATCTCKPGATKCGNDCCGKGETCCEEHSKCCTKDEKCCPGDICCGKSETCCEDQCCDPARNEFCLAKKGKDPTCKKNCAPANQCGGECCGTGYRCDPKRKVCVL